MPETVDRAAVVVLALRRKRNKMCENASGLCPLAFSRMKKERITADIDRSYCRYQEALNQNLEDMRKL